MVSEMPGQEGDQDRNAGQRRHALGDLDDDVDWSAHERDDRPRGMAVTSLGAVLMILAAIAICCCGSYLIAADAWSFVTDY
ncbi:MAG TPA: hypothetical protein VFX60_16355 [Micromonospora sp.]|nr:hypothetical protein [Micromonospora sp.]